MATLHSTPSGSQSCGVLEMQRVGRWLRTIVTAFLVGMVLLLAVRRLAGALSDPLPAGVYLLLGLLFASTAVFLRNAFEALNDTWIRLAGGMVAVAGALSVSFSQSPIAGLVLMWAAIAVEEGWAWRQWFDRARPVVTPFSNRTDTIEPNLQPTADAFSDPSVTQQLVRRRNPDGSESVSGSLRADFAVGQRTINVHVGFCPPLGIAPACEAEATDGPPAEIRVAQVLPQGARLEAKLDSRATERQQIVIEFSAFETEKVVSTNAGHG